MRLMVRVGNEERLQSAVSFKILASDSIKPNKLRFHLQTTHPVASFSKSQKGLCTWNTTGWNFDVSTKVSHGNKEQFAELRNMYSTFNSGLELQIMLLSTHTTQYVLQRILGQFWINLAAMTLCMLTNSNDMLWISHHCASVTETHGYCGIYNHLPRQTDTQNLISPEISRNNVVI